MYILHPNGAQCLTGSPPWPGSDSYRSGHGYERDSSPQYTPRSPSPTRPTEESKGMHLHELRLHDFQA